MREKNEMKERWLFGFVLCLSMLGVTIITIAQVMAKDFGTNGNVHKIVEQPFLQMIDDRLQKVDMEKEREKMEKLAKDRIHNPLPIETVKPAEKGRVFYYDPTYTLDQDAVLPCGKILHRAGTKVNPLEHMNLERRLFFVDARQNEQIKWLKSKLKELENEQNSEVIENKIILVGGSPLKLEEEMKVNIYYDQNGELTTKFGIKASPAIAEQEGVVLRIEEFGLAGRIEVLHKANNEK
jgi:conjugal transfer pilus assembly protein TraW